VEKDISKGLSLTKIAKLETVATELYLIAKATPASQDMLLHIF